MSVASAAESASPACTAGATKLVKKDKIIAPPKDATAMYMQILNNKTQMKRMEAKKGDK